MIVFLAGFVWNQYSVNLELCMDLVDLLIDLIENSVKFSAFNLEILDFPL